MLAACDHRLGSIRVRPVQPRPGRAAELVILQARKGGRAAFGLEAPLVMHEGASHKYDCDDYTSQVVKILRGGDALPWGT